MALTSAMCSAVATTLIQRGLRRSNFYAGFWINVTVGMVGLGLAGPLFDSAINITAAMVAASAFVLASGHGGALRCDARSLFYFVGGGVAENTGVFLVLVALGLGDVSVVIPLAGTAPLFVLLLAYLFPSAVEKLGWRVVAGAGAPRARAAPTYSVSRSASTEPRTMRATAGTPQMPTASVVLSAPGPRAATMAIASKR